MKVMLNGSLVDFEACVNLMDDDIREFLAGYDIENEQYFLDTYCVCHKIKFDEEFDI